MTLTDIFELQKEISQCKNPSDIQKLFDDNDEDCNFETAEFIFNSRKKFIISEENAFINCELIFCPKCKNSFPNKILSNAVEVISTGEIVHFGCCECGTMWNMETRHHLKNVN